MTRETYKPILKFTLSSFLSFLLDYLLFFMMVLLFSSNPWNLIIANVSARIISASFNYFINCTFVFQNKSGIASVARYFLLALFILMVNSILLALFTRVFAISSSNAKLVTEGTLFIISWFIQKLVVFNKM